MNTDQRFSLRKLLDEIVPWYRPCTILDTTIALEDLPNVGCLADSLMNWTRTDAIATAEQLHDANASSEKIAVDSEARNFDLIDKIPETVAHESTIFAFAIPLITKEDRLALILYYSSGPLSIRPCWTVAALGKQRDGNDWQLLVQYFTCSAQQI